MVSETSVLKQEPQLQKKKAPSLWQKIRGILAVSLLCLRMVLGTVLVFLKIVFKPGKRSRKGGREL